MSRSADDLTPARRTEHLSCARRSGRRIATQHETPATSARRVASGGSGPGSRRAARDERAQDERAQDERAQDERARDERAQDERARDERAQDEKAGAR